MNTFILIILSIGLVLLIYYRLLKPWLLSPFIHKHVSTEEFEKFFKTLYIKGVHDSQLHIDDECSKDFIQSRVAISGINKIILIDFPNANWSKELVPTVRDIGRANAVKTVSVEINQGDVSEYIIFDFGDDYKKASRIASLIAEAIIENKPDNRKGRFSIYFKGLPP